MVRLTRGRNAIFLEQLSGDQLAHGRSVVVGSVHVGALIDRWHDQDRARRILAESRVVVRLDRGAVRDKELRCAYQLCSSGLGAARTVSRFISDKYAWACGVRDSGNACA